MQVKVIYLLYCSRLRLENGRWVKARACVGSIKNSTHCICKRDTYEPGYLSPEDSICKGCACVCVESNHCMLRFEQEISAKRCQGVELIAGLLTHLTAIRQPHIQSMCQSQPHTEFNGQERHKLKLDHTTEKLVLRLHTHPNNK